MSTEDIATQKDRARAMWAAGHYPTVAHTIWPVGERAVQHAGVGPGDRVLDVACGTGNATLRAARATGGGPPAVVGLDLTPELLALGRIEAARQGLDITWVEGDAEALPFPDASFDVVLSTFGCMFAPRHEVVAREIARVAAPGGRVTVCAWTPEGLTGDFFRLLGGHLPPPPPGPAPVAWGDEGHVRELFAGTGLELTFVREHVAVRFDSLAEAVDVYTTAFGPIVTARRTLEPQGRWPALVDDLTGLLEERGFAAPEGAALEYLVILGHRPGAGPAGQPG